MQIFLPSHLPSEGYHRSSSVQSVPLEREPRRQLPAIARQSPAADVLLPEATRTDSRRPEEPRAGRHELQQQLPQSATVAL